MPNLVLLRDLSRFSLISTLTDWTKKMAKADLSFQNPKRKLWVTTHFSETIELKFGKKLSYIICILTFF